MALLRKKKASKPESRRGLVYWWTQLLRHVSRMDARVYSGVRKIVDDLHWEFPGSEFFRSDPGITFSDLCFTERGKMGQLSRNYLNILEWDKAVAKVQSRKGKPHTSVAIRLTALGKDSRSQGHCMQALVLSMTRDCNTIDIFYRSTEVTQKFCADLLFFHRTIQERLLSPLGMAGDDIKCVRFHFANAYLSCVFIPVAFRFMGDAVEYLEEFRSSDPRFWRTSCMVAARYMRTVNVYNYMTQKKQYLAMHIPEMDAIRGQLKSYLKEHIQRISEEQGDHMFAEEEDE